MIMSIVVNRTENIEIRYDRKDHFEIALGPVFTTLKTLKSRRVARHVIIFSNSIGYIHSLKTILDVL